VTDAPKPARPRSALTELTIARFKLFFREPSAMFWTFGFPVILAIALGVAFRNKPADPVRVAVLQGPDAESIRSALQSDVVYVRVEDLDAARQDLRSGKIGLLVIPGAPGTPRTYRYDDTRPSWG
jgi:ABC-2 type transport system permease protein